MNYAHVYDQFIADRRQQEATLKQYERHHIVPRCLGGSDCAFNLIKLSYDDHLFAHTLLARIHGGLLANALIRMLGHNNYKGKARRLHHVLIKIKAVEFLREKSLDQWRDGESSIRNRTDEWNEKTAQATRSMWEDPEYRAKQRAARSTPEYKEKRKQQAQRQWSEGTIGRAAQK